MRPLITTANARAYAAKSHEARKRNTALALLEPQPEPQFCDEPNRISHVIALTLDELDNPKLSPKERAMLSKSLRDLRETYHLVTGKPRPGMIKEGKWGNRREIPRVVQSFDVTPTTSSPVRLEGQTPTDNDLPKQ